MTGLQLTVSHLKVLRDFLYGVSTKWYDIGIELGMDIGTLLKIQHRYGSDSVICLREMLTIWLKSADPHPSSTALADALRAKVVGESALAEQGIQK